MTTLTDLARNSAPRNVAGDIGRLFGEAIAKKIATDLTALLGGFSGGIGAIQYQAFYYALGGG